MLSTPLAVAAASTSWDDARASVQLADALRDSRLALYIPAGDFAELMQSNVSSSRYTNAIHATKTCVT